MMKQRKKVATAGGKATAHRTRASTRKLQKEQTAAESLEALANARSKYKERGDAASCGDWLAVALKEHCHTEDGIEIGKFEHVLKENAIEWNINRKLTAGLEGLV